MESLNLNTLVNSLPAQQNAEKELLNDFKGALPFSSLCASSDFGLPSLLSCYRPLPSMCIRETAAALSITTLYRSSRKNAKRAYNAGYATACQDLLNFIQHNVSVESSDGSNPSGMVSKVMDWTEARLDAIKATEEDEEEDEERENAKERGGRSAETSKPSSGNAKKGNVNAVASTSRTSVRESLLLFYFSSEWFLLSAFRRPRVSLHHTLLTRTLLLLSRLNSLRRHRHHHLQVSAHIITRG